MNSIFSSILRVKETLCVRVQSVMELSGVQEFLGKILKEKIIKGA